MLAADHVFGDGTRFAELCAQAGLAAGACEIVTFGATPNSSNTLVRSEEQLATVIGLDNIVVVATDDAVLVADKSQTDKVKQPVEQLKTEGHAEASRHRRMYRPWGYYQSIDQGARYEVKRIVVRPGGVPVVAEAFSPRRTLDRRARRCGREPQRRDARRARERGKTTSCNSRTHTTARKATRMGASASP